MRGLLRRREYRRHFGGRGCGRRVAGALLVRIHLGGHLVHPGQQLLLQRVKARFNALHSCRRRALLDHHLLDYAHLRRHGLRRCGLRRRLVPLGVGHLAARGRAHRPEHRRPVAC